MSVYPLSPSPQPVDEAIGRLLGDFIVNSNADALLIRKIAQDVQARS